MTATLPFDETKLDKLAQLSVQTGLALEQGHLLPPRGRGGVQPLDGILLRLLCVAEPLLELARRHEEEVR